ncbi:hypothetical protein N7539_005460 [Penicillium diatomitis]|uniref:Uncharacterized protein n=1 Tax=Penicillium diatomitis TaxID=2819901 RepID=A0A9W9X711_9EURO|nr:uncharacterized protein N7539_005460 [Penicillium diatomitis]KAJ5485472.1 hypothetical protein N7539_005460 [Penicillium diatomitis]
MAEGGISESTRAVRNTSESEDEGKQSNTRVTRPSSDDRTRALCIFGQASLESPDLLETHLRPEPGHGSMGTMRNLIDQ